MAVLKFWQNFVFLILGVPFIAAKPSEPRIFNGVEAISENTHHQVSVRFKQPDTIFYSGHICGGSLVAPKVVLSAAHCFYNEDEGVFYNESDFHVVMGSLNLYENTENTISFNISHMEFHNLSITPLENDVALLFLDGEVPSSNPDVSVIPMNKEEILVGTVCQATGWGIAENGGWSAKLKTVDLPIMDKETCSLKYGNSISDGVICAGSIEGGKNTCLGDDGGPLVCNGKLAGIISSVKGCAEPGLPGVNTNVSYYAEWIDETIKKNSANLSSLSSAVILAAVFLTALLNYGPVL